MDNSICKFMPVKNDNGSLKVLRFVYETELSTLPQPFLPATYNLYLVAGGSAVLKTGEKTYPLKRGDLFFSFPLCPFEITDDRGLVYIYISFMGTSAPALLQQLQIGPERCIYHDFEDLLAFWKDAIVRVNQSNANILSESVLLYTLSFISGNPADSESKAGSAKLFDMLVKYVDSHYQDADLSVKKLSVIFPYSEKYLSSLFFKRMNIRFSTYLNSLRIQYARELMAEGADSIAEISERCGYSDPMYFSKVFKKYTHQTPSAYMTALAKQKP